MTLFEKLTEWREYERRKHGLSTNFTKESINDLTNYEFLQEISEALEEMMKEKP